MEERKGLLDYIGEVFFIFGITIVFLNIFNFIFGDSASEYSTMFKMGSEALAADTMVQFFVMSIIVVIVKIVFFSDKLIKNMRMGWRTCGMLVSIVTAMAVFIVIFEWFPVKMWEAWAMFALCFGISVSLGIIIASYKERADNKKLEEALKKIKEDGKELDYNENKSSGRGLD